MDEEELAHLWSTLNASPNPTAFLFKLLLLTGAREKELRESTWNQFDLDQGIWAKTTFSPLKNQRKIEYLSLSEKALAVLKELESLKMGSAFLFSGKKKDKPLQNAKNCWKSILQKARIEDLKVQDLRETYAYYLVSSNLSVSVIRKLLGYPESTITQRIIDFSDDTLRKATNMFGKKISEVICKTV